MIGRYKIVATGNPVGMGVAGSLHAQVAAFAKENSANAPYCIANELICGGIAQVIGLPMPPCGIMVDTGSGTEYFASLDFNLQGAALPPADVDKCVVEVPWEATGLLLFDVLVGNADRHAANFSLDTSSVPPEMSIFDHSHALFGWVDGKGSDRLNDLMNRLALSGGSHSQGNRHCLLDVLDTDNHFDEWIDRIKAIPDYFIEERASAATGHGIDASEASSAIVFLKHRKKNLRDIVHTHRAEFKAISTWSIFT